MKVPKVHILATVRKEELLPATLLVFKSLRVGFPTANVRVFLNEPEFGRDIIERAALDAGCEVVGIPRTTHHEWLAGLIKQENKPWVSLDTDVIFWNSVEDWNITNFALAGRYTPQFFDKFANAITRPRLHTSLLWINPQKVRDQIETYGELFPDVYCTPRPKLADLVYPRYIPISPMETSFYDTCSLLFTALGGYAFPKLLLDAYDHLQFGTLSDLVAPCYPEYRWRETQFAIFENPELARGSWKVQDAFYAKHAC